MDLVLPMARKNYIVFFTIVKGKKVHQLAFALKKSLLIFLWLTQLKNMNDHADESNSAVSY